MTTTATMPAIDARSDLRRWAASAVVVLGLHAGGAAVLLSWHEPVTVGEPSDTVVVDLEPVVNAPSDTAEDLPPGPKQDEAEATPPPKQEEVEQKPDEKVDVPPTPAPSVAVPLPEPVAPKPPEPSQVMPAPATTAPPPAHASQAQISKWQRDIVMQFERHKAYPRAAKERGEIGVVQLDFTIDREGRVTSSAIAKSSGYAALDEETLATVRRAQPFPTPPAGVGGTTFQFKLPVRFNIR
jgi:protein TonB